MFFTLMPLCLDFYVLDLHVYLIHEYHQIPYEKDHNKLLEDDRQTHSSKRRASEKRIFKDLIEGRFDVTRIEYIDREDDRVTIFGKAADFSRESIMNLEKEGYNDTQKAIQEHADLVVSKEGSYKIPIESCLS
jgi:hypothetical protein